MNDKERKEIKDELICDCLDTKKHYIRIILQLVGAVLFIIGCFIIWHYYDWKLFIAILFLLFSHEIEKHWKTQDPIREKMRDQFIKELNNITSDKNIEALTNDMAGTHKKLDKNNN